MNNQRNITEKWQIGHYFQVMQPYKSFLSVVTYLHHSLVLYSSVLSTWVLRVLVFINATGRHTPWGVRGLRHPQLRDSSRDRFMTTHADPPNVVTVVALLFY